MLYLPRPWLQSGLVDTGGDDPGFAANLCDDRLLARSIRAACSALFRPSERLTRDAALDAVLDRLRPHLRRPRRGTPGGRVERVARRAGEWLQDDMAVDIALAQVAGAVDRFQLARAFRAAYGTSPHAYLV
jgi:AraC-like DNA-binding protein